MRLQQQPQDTPEMTRLQVDIVPLMKNFLTLFFRWFSIHFTIYPSNLYFVSLSTKIMGDHVKGFAKAEVGIHCSPLIHLVSHIIVESNVFGQAKFSFHKSMQTIPITFLSSMCLETVSRKISSFTFAGIELKPIGLQFPAPSFVKKERVFALFQSSGVSPNHHDHSK